MRKICFLYIIISITACKSTRLASQNPSHMITREFEQFDIGKYQVQQHNEPRITLPDGTSIVQSGNRETGFIVNTTPPKPSFFVVYKYYYGNGNIREKAVILGADTYVGKSYQFDEKGKLTKETNEDAAFGKFGYNDVLRYLHQQKMINIHTGENRDKLHLKFNNIDGRKTWEAEIEINGFNNLYVLDGETGEVLKKANHIPIRTVE